MTQIDPTPRLTEDPPEEGSGGTSGGGGKTGRTRRVVLDDLAPQAEPEEEGEGNAGGRPDKQPGQRKRPLDPSGIVDPNQD